MSEPVGPALCNAHDRIRLSETEGERPDDVVQGSVVRECGSNESATPVRQSLERRARYVTHSTYYSSQSKDKRKRQCLPQRKASSADIQDRRLTLAFGGAFLGLHANLTILSKLDMVARVGAGRRPLHTVRTLTVLVTGGQALRPVLSLSHCVSQGVRRARPQCTGPY